jgi:crotonobetainyl-CoA:carnitine CoA-transferase CaiB-like acyl-CoA transferase
VHGLKNIRVVDHSSGIAGPYCSKLFADAGADVIKLELPEGDPLRCWSATGAELEGKDGGLFRYLNASKRSVVGTLADAGSDALLASADLLIEDLAPDALDRDALRERHPGLVLLSITPFGLVGPLAGRAATDFTIQAEGASIRSHWRPGQDPYQAGGEVSAWSGGSFAAVAALGAVRGAQQTGRGEHIDFSLQEVTALVTNCYIDLMWGILGRPPVSGMLPNLETPSIEPTRDGFVGFTTYSPQQMSDFQLMIERPELRESGEFALLAQRLARLEEWESIVHGYTREHTTAEIVELAQLMRIPVAPVTNGKTVLEQEQLVARNAFTKDPTGDFTRPLPPYRIDGETLPPPRPAPSLGRDTGRIEAHTPKRPTSPEPPRLPLEGLRIIDATNWWAGPMATHLLAALGADVIHVESIQRIDGGRAVGGMFASQHDAWWECSFIYIAANTNKRGITVDLSNPKGMAVFDALISGADALVENFSPRVMDGFGVTWEKVQALNPRCHYVRMPAFGLDGPWREHVGFAATMEQMAGLSWLTGLVEDQPRIQRGPCDPLAGMHAAFALLVALAERDTSGRGHFVECSMLEAALNVAAEPVIEYTAHGNLMQRSGNRSANAAPQGLYPCRDHSIENPQWLALSVATESQWEALVTWLGSPAWASRIGGDLASRQAQQDTIDGALRTHFAERELEACLDPLVAAGVPAARLVDPRALASHPQLRARGFHEEVSHPLVGSPATMGVPFRYASVDRWLRRAAPMLGQHNSEILMELGYDEAQIAELAAEKVIGDWPENV